MQHFKSPGILLGIIAVVLAVAGTATAAKFITSSDIKDGTIQSRDLSPSLQKLIKSKPKNSANSVSLPVGAQSTGGKGDKGDSGAPGQQGAPGQTGATGPAGTPGAPGKDGRDGHDGHDGGVPDGFFVTNKSVGLTKTGEDFGPYSDGGAAGGSLYYNGFNGKKLSDIKSLAYKFSYGSADGSKIATPYLRIFLNGDNDDVVLDPSECATVKVPEDTSTTLDMASFTKLRYDDDPCGADYKPQTLDAIQAAHGDDVISGIYVSEGFAGGTDVRAKLTDLSVNGKAFHFGE
jgi:hypothetical protein